MDLSDIYFLQEIGEKTNQEDYIWPTAGTATKHDKVFIVCDGVGGSENGEIASRIIAEYVGNAILKMEKPEMSGTIINELLLKAKQVLVDYARQHELNTDMGTTFTLLVLSGTNAFVAWCGDSRIYHLRAGEILYKTADHSLVNTLVKSGEISEEEAMIHPRRNLILRAIKADETPVEADYHFIENIAEGDYFILCTDGLLENITDKQLKSLLIQHDQGSIDLVKAFQEICLGNTKDNYSMYLLRTGASAKHSFYNRKILILTLLLILLITASAVTLSRYFAKKQQIDLNPAAAEPTGAGQRKTTGKEVNAGITNTVPSASQAQDSLQDKSEPAKTIKDSAAAGNKDSAVSRAQHPLPAKNNATSLNGEPSPAASNTSTSRLTEPSSHISSTNKKD